MHPRLQLQPDAALAVPKDVRQISVCTPCICLLNDGSLAPALGAVRWSIRI